MFHKRIADCMQDFSVRFINEKEVWSQSYRKVPISKLLALLAMAPVNILAVGKNESWMINASTPHKRHFVGSSCSNKLYERPSEMTQWDRLKYFVAKFASLGARVDVYWLHQSQPIIERTNKFFKNG